MFWWTRGCLKTFKCVWWPEMDYKHTTNIYGFGRPFFAPSFFYPSTTRPPYFYPSIFIFTRPNDGWTGLYIKLWRSTTWPWIDYVMILSLSKHVARYIFDNERDLGVHFECIKWRNRSKTAKFWTTNSIVCLSFIYSVYRIFYIFILFLLYVNTLCNSLVQMFSLCTIALPIMTLRKIKCTFCKVIINKKWLLLDRKWTSRQCS